MKTLPHTQIKRPAFTLIEILVSVVIISVSIVYIMGIYSENHKQIVYISERNKLAFQDSLFLTENVSKYHKSNKSAYDLLQQNFRIEEYESKEILKQATRDLFIPETEEATAENEVPPISVERILIKDKHSSTYYHVKINAL